MGHEWVNVTSPFGETFCLAYGGESHP
jgi:hypothetical protein